MIRVMDVAGLPDGIRHEMVAMAEDVHGKIQDGSCVVVAVDFPVGWERIYRRVPKVILSVVQGGRLSGLRDQCRDGDAVVTAMRKAAIVKAAVRVTSNRIAAIQLLRIPCRPDGALLRIPLVRDVAKGIGEIYAMTFSTFLSYVSAVVCRGEVTPSDLAFMIYEVALSSDDRYGDFKWASAIRRPSVFSMLGAFRLRRLSEGVVDDAESRDHRKCDPEFSREMLNAVKLMCRREWELAKGAETQDPDSKNLPHTG